LNAHTYDLLALDLRADYHCIAPDLRGHGDSEWSPTLDYDLSAHAGDVDALVERLDLRAFVLVGMSLGGLTALEWAGVNGNRLAALVLIDIGPEVQRSNAIRNFLAQTTGEFDSIESFIAEAVRFNPRRDPKILRRSLLNNLRRTPSGKWTWKHDPRPRQVAAAADPAQQQAAYEARAERLWKAVAAIDCPTLVVRGADSVIFAKSDADKLVARLRHGSGALVEGAGHTVQGDNPAALAREMRAFLRAAGV
jgi:pimeloyl-ACP methyl ester carboxylesterase